MVVATEGSGLSCVFVVLELALHYNSTCDVWLWGGGGIVQRGGRRGELSVGRTTHYIAFSSG